MDLTGYVDDLQQRLASAAAMGGDDARDLARRLSEPLDAAVRLVLFEALAAAAGEITAELAPGSVDVRLRGREPEFVVTMPAGPDFASAEAAALAAAPTASIEADDAATTTRTTLRLPDHVKTRVESAAAAEGLSVNTWLVRAVTAALEPASNRRAAPRESRGQHLTGWVR
ncbi:histidine kinase [Agromyces archimandritae]|uniref:Histidine kinase n=1 Tax=Agromyces archimandritae TaxID=2781962 RepID=A0A975IMZ6_9MICO|nr:histidine kinase [Agromyces archimandritae]QTX04010.1 histidine kinase [Agromyces archimandritae]